jgi:hypothetical protein
MCIRFRKRRIRLSGHRQWNCGATPSPCDDHRSISNCYAAPDNWPATSGNVAWLRGIVRGKLISDSGCWVCVAEPSPMRRCGACSRCEWRRRPASLPVHSRPPAFCRQVLARRLPFLGTICSTRSKSAPAGAEVTPVMSRSRRISSWHKPRWQFPILEARRRGGAPVRGNDQLARRCAWCEG